MPEAQVENIQLQDRDVSLLRGLFESRVMGGQHIAEIYFEGRREYAKKRLQVIKEAGLIAERPRRSTEAAVLYLTGRGMSTLKSLAVLTEYPAASLPILQRRAAVSDLTIRHELEVMSVKAAFYRALRDKNRFSIAEFTTWPRLIEFVARRFNGPEVLVKPDGLIRVRESEEDGLSEHAFYLEVDRSTETLDTLVSRAACYLDHYKSGGFAESQGGTRSQFKDYPFRVLIILKTEERRNNVAERLLCNTPPIFTQVCLTTLEEITEDPLAACWIRPLDYREATEKAGVGVGSIRPAFAYHRQTSRDTQIAAHLTKMRIIDFSENKSGPKWGR